MVDLDSPVWRNMSASCGGTGELSAKLLRRIREGVDDDATFAELYHQVCHQLSVGRVACIAVPHLVDIARTGKGMRLIWALSTIGTVVAARQAHPRSSPSVPEEWQVDYLGAIEEARRLTAEALRATG